MSVPDGAPPMITGDALNSRFEQGMNNANMFLVGKTTPANAVAMLPSAAVAFAVTDGPTKPEYQPPPLTPPKLTMT